MTENTDQERTEFEAKFKHLDFSQQPDAWGQARYEHDAISLAWEAWQARAAIADTSAPLETLRVNPESEPVAKYVYGEKTALLDVVALSLALESAKKQLAVATAAAQVVPQVPTVGMLKAAQKADCDHSPFNEWLQDEGRDFIAMYRAAISAAPTPPLPNCNAA